MESRKPTVIIVDDHDFVLAKIRETIGGDFDVIASLNDGTSVAQMARIRSSALTHPTSHGRLKQ